MPLCYIDGLFCICSHWPVCICSHSSSIQILQSGDSSPGNGDRASDLLLDSIPGDVGELLPDSNSGSANELLLNSPPGKGGGVWEFS